MRMWQSPKYLRFALIAALATPFPGAAFAQAEPVAGEESPKAPLGESLTGMAKAEYEAGRILYADGDYANAIVKFQEAYETSKDPRLLWNIAVCEKNLRRYSRMLSTIRQYEREAAAILTADERAQAAEIIKTVEAFVSVLDLRISEEGAEIFIDDESVGQTPLSEPLIVDVGTRRIRVTKPGFKTVHLTRDIAGGGTVQIDIELEEEFHRGKLIVTAGPDDFISINGNPMGRHQWEGWLPSGAHALRVTSEGMQTYQSEVFIQDDEVRRVSVTLDPLPTSNTTKIVLWAMGGAALATGAVVGGYYLFKPGAPPATQGTINPGSVQLSFGGPR